MHHTHYIELQAQSYFALGLVYGKFFKEYLKKQITKNRLLKQWRNYINKSRDFFLITSSYFPQYIEEVKGITTGTNLDLSEIWTTLIIDDLNWIQGEKCTTMITNQGQLFSHNEDWEPSAKDLMWIVKKTLPHISIFELRYANSLGGTAASVNSNGWIMGINSLIHSDQQIGVPSAIIGRYLSETKNPVEDFEKLTKIKRAQGFNHVFLHKDKGIVNIECTSKKQVLTQPRSPFLHANHYLNKQLLSLENTQNNTFTFERYNYAQRNLKNSMTAEQIISLNSSEPIMNNRTIAKMIIDFKTNTAKIWLLREKEKSWIDYQLDFLYN